MKLNEDSLKAGDLRDLVKHVFEVDNYKSKMGEDKDIVVISFTVESKEPADDIVEFVEKGYQFVLDADATPGELDDGKYRVFVELKRTPRVAEEIEDMLYGLGKLTGIERFKFRYHKNFDSLDAVKETLANTIPLDPMSYETSIMERRIDNLESFFSKSMLESVKLTDDILEIKKIYAEPLRFRVLEHGPREAVLKNLKESINVNDWGEVIYLVKYIGDYDITKFGNKLVLENQGHTLVLERLQ
jgi:hypothetical protein